MAHNSAKTRQPFVFIGGAGRSGTTLVVDMLGLHASISPIYETSFVITLMNLLLRDMAPTEQLASGIMAEMEQWTRPLPKRPHFKREHERFFHGPHYVLFERPYAMERTRQLVDELGRKHPPAEALASFLTDLFNEHVARDVPGKSRVANKTPDYVLHLPQLQMVFPGMRFIHCVRDGRDVAASVMSRPWGPRSVSAAAEWWQQRVSAGMRFADANPGQSICVKYEDLIGSTSGELTRLLNWLGEEDQASRILAHYEQGPIKIIGDGDKRPAGLAQADRDVVTSVARDTLAALGYI